MVKLCTEPYPETSKYNAHFEVFPYPLSDFQKYAIEAIIEGQHVLTTAHTGSGKTLAAEFAIQYFVEQGKKVIYTSPIKALSNQKYYEFSKKYPHITFGLMTGDIKTNPNADVLIMTTEILMNSLYNLALPLNEHQTSANTRTSLQFQIDIQSQLACVVFDEVHYINDEHRGHVWEQTILMLPPHIQMIMLSATIDGPEKFAQWCESCKERVNDIEPKQVYLASTNYRVVPLTHYGYVGATESLYKTTKNKELEQKLRNATNKIVKLQTEKGQFLEDGYKEIAGILEIIQSKELFMKRKFVLNNLATYLKNNEMLPAIAFMFSRKQVEMCAKEITAVLLEDDSKVPYTIKRECDAIIRKLPNHQEYLELPEYNELVALLEKGVAIHHSGMIPILREIVELMISKGYIKLLFATESFAIGLDCPIRTAIFTELTKYDGNTKRNLMAHEYTQMAGRAGRRGIDTLGYVVHCNNLFELPTVNAYKTMLSGKPQNLVSKFHIDYSMILNLLKRGKTTEFADFVHKSMIHNEIAKQSNAQTLIVDALRVKCDEKEQVLKWLRTPQPVCETYINLEQQLTHSVNKKRREIEKQMKLIQDAHKTWKEDIISTKVYHSIKFEYEKEQTQQVQLESYIQSQIIHVCNVLKQNGFVSKSDSNQNDGYTLTPKGQLAAHTAEIHPLIITDLLCKWNQMADFSVVQIVGLLSCFIDVKVAEEHKLIEPDCKDAFLKSRIKELRQAVYTYQSIELEKQMYTGLDYNILMYDLIDDIMYWCVDCNDESACKLFIQTRLAAKRVSVGDFTKACLKICAIANEWISVGELFGYIEWIHKLSQIDKMLLKYIATTQSLYV
jgi:superfamily II RNA helicase